MKKNLIQGIMMKLQEVIQSIEKEQLKTDLPKLDVGDTIRVGTLIQEGNKQRVQNYQGTIIAISNSQLNQTITVRRIFQGIGIERIFPLHSPFVKTIEVIRKAKVRRAKLYYLRDRVGKATRLKEKFEMEKK
uniref:Large ribosomal subunit protein bL19c n=1 Tax=Marsupiomonas sp. NIES 1824 TaxID=1562198 RepID=A0A097KLW4_9CHLO|nr:ribosomal protein L19 [Marsupiomonas sp. NIES 1824]